MNTQMIIKQYVLRQFRQLGCAMNEKLTLIGTLLAKHCEFIAAQRARRACQICTLYRHIYTEATFRSMVNKFAANYGSRLRHGRNTPFGMLLGAAFFSWEKEKITEGELESCAEDLHALNAKPDAVQFKFSGHANVKYNWELVVNKEHLKVWRKAISDSYLYEYKVYGTFYDIPARAFFDVQRNTEYRKKWDKLVISLDTVDVDEKTGCEVIHWVMHYPFPMYSREYVYIRRCHVDAENRVMVLVSKATEHPCCPINNQYVRVSEYSSSMVIKPHDDFDMNGFDYVLTYFDDPKAMFPGPAYSWMATSGVPEFVEKLHQAAIVLHQELMNSSASSDSLSDQQPSYLRPKSGMVSSSSQMPVYA